MGPMRPYLPVLLAGGCKVASTGCFSRSAGAANRSICPCFSYEKGRKTR